MRFFYLGLTVFIYLALQSHVIAVSLDQDTAQKIKKMKTQLSEKEKRVVNIKAKIGELESQLGENNNQYVQVIRIRRSIETDIFHMKEQLEDNLKKLKMSIQESRSIVNGVILSRLEQQNSAAAIYTERIVLERLQYKINELETSYREQEALKNEISQLEQRYYEYSSIESDLAELVIALEQQRDVVTGEYIGLNRQKKEMGGEYERLKTKVFLSDNQEVIHARNLVGGISFAGPLRHFSALEHQDRGVTFRFEGAKEILNTAEGRVAYIGTLSTYGNVLMVDHGNDTRSVFLGDFHSQVEVGQTVAKGDIIARASSDNNRRSNELYFEVRKSNIVQNTILLLDREHLLTSVASGLSSGHN